jgi:hypothetical protein
VLSVSLDTEIVKYGTGSVIREDIVALFNVTLQFSSKIFIERA